MNVDGKYMRIRQFSSVAGQSNGRRPRPPRRHYNPDDIEAYHFHTYFYAKNPSSVEEAMAFRKATRYQINMGFLHDCSLNQVIAGVEGPHPYAQYELCCNKSSLPEATAWHMQNHGNLSVLIHPLTRKDLEDHAGRATWMGPTVPLDLDCDGCLVELLPEARICPVYPYYPDRLSRAEFRYIPLEGTEDYLHLRDKIGSENSTNLPNTASTTVDPIEYLRDISDLLQNNIDTTIKS